MKTTNYILTHEESSLIRNLLHMERVYYLAQLKEHEDKYGSGSDPKGGVYLQTIQSAIASMENYQKY